MPPEVRAAMCQAVESELAQRNCANVQPPEPNGCGPVAGVSPPQSIFGADLGAACNSHDRCYASPGVSQYYCDSQFLIGLTSVCLADYAFALDLARELPTWERAEAIAFAGAEYAVCQAIALSYSQAVFSFGFPRYIAAQQVGACAALREAETSLCGAP
jgi:hypothetical protein